MSPAKDLIFDPYGDVLLVLGKGSAPTVSLLDAETAAHAETHDDDKVQLGPAVEYLSESAVQPEQTARQPKQADTFEVKVSSRHLALASRVFRAMFDGNFRERVQPRDHELTKVPLPDDDPDAMMILLGVIHGLNKRVSRTIDKPSFIAVTILIDKYELHESSQVYADMWFDDLWAKRSLSTPHLTDWIYVCWVLGKAMYFKSLTKRAISDCGSKFEDNGLPFPEFIASK